MSYNVLLSSSFQREFKALHKKYPSIAKDLSGLIDVIKDEPFTGTSIGKGCYKIRLSIASKGKGKSGGARVITCVKIVNLNVYLISIYDKSDKESLDDNELTVLLEAAGLL